MTLWKQITGAALALVLFVPLAFSQMTRGTILGTVTDPSGAVVPGVAIKVTNTATGVTRDSETNEAGIYRIPGVEPGTYDVTYSRSGFESVRTPGIVVTTAQEVTINPTLQVGTSATAVTIVDNVVGVDLSKSTATIERTFQTKLLNELPLNLGNTRDLNVLALLAPTATRAPGSTGVAANGQRARNNNFMLDGVDNNDPSVTIANLRLIPEAVNEYQVQTSPYSAEFGRSSGAQISAVTRSGTNAFHGEAYDYFRSTKLEPLSLINKRAGLTATPRGNNNQAGGSLGGPVLIPGLYNGKNRTFFFALVEANRLRQAADARNATAATIPTQAGFNMLSSVPLGTGQTTASRQATVGALGFLNQVYALNPNFINPRNVAVNGVNIPFGQITIPLANPHDFWYATGRLDHALSSKDQINYRYLIDDRLQPDVVSNLQFGSLFSGGQKIRRENHAVSHTRTQSATLVNEFRFAYIKALLDFPENDPRSATTTISGAFTIGGATNFPQGRTQDQFQFQDTVTKIYGRHSMKFGANLSYLKLLNNAAFNSKGAWTFDNFADYLNNRAANFQVALDVASFDARQLQQAYFFQDDWKVSRNLTLNIGARFETSNMPFGAFGATDSQSLAAGVPGPVKNDRNNWAPRIGFAWNPSGGIFGEGRTVIRGGYGMTYDYLFFNILTVNASNFPRVRTALLDRSQVVNQYPSQATGTPPGFSALNTYVNSPVDLQSPTAHIYSLSIQRQIATNYILELGYSGSRSYHGIRQGQANPGLLTEAQAATVRSTGNANSIPAINSRRVNPWGSRVLIESTAGGLYNAAFVKFDRKLSKGLLIGANYTYSSNFSDNDESLGVAAITNSSPQIPQDFFNYRPEWSRSVFDRPHRIAAYWTWNLPGSGLSNGFARRVIGGWTFSGIADAQSGQPFTMFTGVDTHGNGSTAARPDLNQSGTLTRDPVSGDLRTFTVPRDAAGIVTTFRNAAGNPLANTRGGSFGNLGRNTFRGPLFVNYNASVRKDIGITERVKVRVAGDFGNIFNHRNFGNAISNMNSLQYGTNTTDPGARQVTLNLKVMF